MNSKTNRLNRHQEVFHISGFIDSLTPTFVLVCYGYVVVSCASACTVLLHVRTYTEAGRLSMCLWCVSATFLP